MLGRLLMLPLTRAIAAPVRSVLCLAAVPSRSFAVTPPPKGGAPRGTKLDHYLITTVTELDRKQKEKIIMKPNEYFSQLEKVMRMLDDPKSGSITSEESVSAIIYLCVMTAHSLPKLSPLEVIRAVQFLYYISNELGFRFPKEHIDSILAAVPDPFPKDLERVFPFFIKLVTRLPDPAAAESIRPKVGTMTDKYLAKHKDELKVQDITAILEAWMQVGYKNEESLKILMEHVSKFAKIMTFNAADVHVLFYYEATQMKTHDKSYIDVLVEKAKEHIATMDLYLLTNLLSFRKTLKIEDEDFLKTIVEGVRVFLKGEKLQIPPLTFTQLLLALHELDPVKNKDLQDKIIQHFINDKEILQNPQYWTTLPAYLLMVAGDQVKTENKEFYAKLDGLLEKAVLNVTPDFVVQFAKIIFKGRYNQVKPIVNNFVETCKKIQKSIRPEDKQALKVIVGDSKEFAGFPF